MKATISCDIPGEWDVESSAKSKQHFNDWDKLVKFISREFNAVTTIQEKLDEISKIIDS